MLLGVVMGFAQYPRTTFQVPECIFKMAGSRYPENRTEDACSLCFLLSEKVFVIVWLQLLVMRSPIYALSVSGSLTSQGRVQRCEKVVIP